MKHFVAFLALLLSPVVCMAQQNPVPGYIITQANDTIRGTIDFLSREKSAHGCLFRKEGNTEFRNYAPSDIRGYRFQDNGVYYVTRTFPLDGRDQTFFAEFLLQGGVSLYRYQAGNLDAVFYLVDESGSVAVVSDYGDLSRYTPTDAAVHKRQALKGALTMLSKSETARDRLWNEGITAQNLLNIVRQYDMDYCTSSGDCVVFEYDARRSSASTMRFFASLGGVVGKVSQNNDPLSLYSVSAVGWRVDAGLEWTFPRLNEHITLQTGLSFCRWSGSGDRERLYGTAVQVSNEDLDYSTLALRANVLYHFQPKRQVRPFVCGGLSIVGNFIDGKLTSGSIDEQDSGMELPADIGVAAGGGVDFRVGNHLLRGTVQYEHLLVHRDVWHSGLSCCLTFVY